MYTDDIIKLVICFTVYYFIMFIQIFAGEKITLEIILKKYCPKHYAKINKKSFNAVLKNILLSYLAGYICAFICISLQETNIFVIPIYIFGIIFSFPFGTRNNIIIQSVMYADILGTFLFSLVIHFSFFLKKLDCSKKQSIVLSTILSVLTAPYMLFFSFVGFFDLLNIL